MCHEKPFNHDLINCLLTALSSYLVHLDDVIAVSGHFTPGRYLRMAGCT